MKTYDYILQAETGLEQVREHLETALGLSATGYQYGVAENKRSALQKLVDKTIDLHKRVNTVRQMLDDGTYRKNGHSYVLVDMGTLDTCIMVDGVPVEYSQEFAADYRTADGVFDLCSFVEDNEDDLLENLGY